VLGDGFGDWVGAGFREVGCQRSGAVCEGIEFDGREVSCCEGAGLVEEDSRHVLSISSRPSGSQGRSNDELVYRAVVSERLNCFEDAFRCCGQRLKTTGLLTSESGRCVWSTSRTVGGGTGVEGST